MELQLCDGGFSLFAGRMLANLYQFGVNRPSTLCENIDGYISLLNFECLKRYKKLLLYNSEKGDLHDAIKSIQNGFCFNLKKEQKFF